MKLFKEKIRERVIFGLSVFALALLSSCNDSDDRKAEPLSGSVKQTQVSPSKESPQSDAQETESSESSSLIKCRSRFVVGNAEIQKRQKDWMRLLVNKKVVENDKIRTAEAAEVVLAVQDGSALKIPEKTEVQLAAESKNGQKKLILLDIKYGRVHFDVQKQRERELRFTTGTAAAAIRGTAGFVGNLNGKMFASLKEGMLDVTNKAGKTNSIVKKQTVFVDEHGKAKVLNLASSGTEALSKAIDSFALPEVSVAVLEKSLKKFDDAFVKEQKIFEKKVQFRATPIADTLFVPTVTLTARATPGIWVTVLGESDSIGANGIYQRTFEWDDSEYGSKRFLASCSDGHVEFPCYTWVTEYAPVSTLDGSASENRAESSSQSAGKADDASKNVKLSVKVNGPRSERIHLDLPAKELNTNLKFSLAEISATDLNQLQSLSVLRNGKPFKNFGKNELTSLAYEVPVTIARNKIADFEVVATLKNGKKFRAKKTFEVYCLVSNHPGGKARNTVVPLDQEYERLKQSGQLTHE